MDIWRIRPAGGDPERITFHNSRVGYPTLLDERTLLYLATGQDGSGPWLYGMDIERRVPHRISFGVEILVDRGSATAEAGGDGSQPGSESVERQFRIAWSGVWSHVALPAVRGFPGLGRGTLYFPRRAETTESGSFSI
jgi:hypothetical protein